MKKFFENLDIRDTTLKTSPTHRIDRFQSKTIVINNTLNQSVEIRILGIVAPDIPLEVPVKTVSKGANTLSYEIVNEYFPFLKITAKCSTTPTSGKLDVYLLAMEEK